jgi:uncharacterized membrane protein YebE (DUF533 family)
MRADGTLSPEERAKLNRQENHLSHQIYNQKHDAQTAGTGGGRIERRDAEEQKRISQGVASGQLTPKEAASLEKKETKLQEQERKARADGVVTAQERHRIDKKQDNLSHQIYRQKHDQQTTH